MSARMLAPLAAAASAAALLAPTAPATAIRARAAASPRCHTINLRIRAGRATGAAGSVIVAFYLRNITNHPCHTRGYAGLLLVSSHGRVLPTFVTPDAFTARHRITLGSRQLAKFLVAFHLVDLSHGGGACHSPTARYVHVIPPDESAYRNVRLRGGGITPCHGRLGERPIER